MELVKIRGMDIGRFSFVKFTYAGRHKRAKIDIYAEKNKSYILFLRFLWWDIHLERIVTN